MWNETAFVAIALVPFVVLGLLILGMWQNAAREKSAATAMRLRYEQYIAQHGGTYIEGIADMPVGGSFSEAGAYDVLSSSLAQGNAFQLYHQLEVRGSGNARTVLERTVCAIAVPDIMAQFIVNSKLNEQNVDTSKAVYTDSQIVRLEGNFSDFYSVYAPQGDQTQLLTLLAPDVMEYIFENLSDYDIEIKNKTLYLYAFRDMNADDGLGMVERGEELVRRLKLRALDARLVTQTSAGSTLVAPAATGKQQRTKLVSKRRIVAATIISGCFAVFGIVYSIFDDSVSQDTRTTLAFVIVGILLASALVKPYTTLRRNRLRQRYEAVARQPHNRSKS